MAETQSNIDIKGQDFFTSMPHEIAIKFVNELSKEEMLILRFVCGFMRNLIGLKELGFKIDEFPSLIYHQFDCKIIQQGKNPNFK